MTVCRFYLQGRCRYGDRCWNEHTDPPSPPPQRRDQYTWVAPSSNSSRNYSQPQQSRANFSNQYKGSGSRYGYDSYDEYDSRNSSPNRDQHSDRYGYGTVSSGYYDHRRTESFDRNSTPKKNTTFHLQSSNRFEALSHTNERGRDEKDSNLISMVKSDITEWEEAHMWPFSCCSHFNDREACMSGFVDISPEELRCTAYEAENNSAFDFYTGTVAGALEAIRKKWNILKNPTPEVLQSIESYHGTPDFCEENLKKLIPGIGTVGTPGGAQINSGIFPSQQASGTSATFSFKSAHLDPTGSLGSSSSAFKSVSPANNQTGSSFQAFGSAGSSGFGSTASSGFGSTASSGFGSTASSGFGSTASSGFGSTASSGFGSTASSGFGSTASSGFGLKASSSFGSTASSGFGSAPASSGSSLFGSSSKITKTVGGLDLKSCAYTVLENLTESEQAQFSSQTFTLGKIPSRPPPIELCF